MFFNKIVQNKGLCAQHPTATSCQIDDGFKTGRSLTEWIRMLKGMKDLSDDSAVHLGINPADLKCPLFNASFQLLYINF
jgi:hypothetical protein